MRRASRAQAQVGGLGPTLLGARLSESRLFRGLGYELEVLRLQIAALAQSLAGAAARSATRSPKSGGRFVSFLSV